MDNPIWLIHGWAANARIFDTLREQLPENTVAPDLPGHGAAAFDGVFDITRTADDFARHMVEPVHVVGWSLGGLVAMMMALRHPEKIKTLCLCSTFAKFQAAPDYPEGLANPALGKMATLFRADYGKYMRQFLELQLLFAPQARAMIDTMASPVVAQGTPAALESALDALAAADLRENLDDIAAPVLLIYGSRDAITPPRMGEYLLRHIPNARLDIIDNAAHAPFLSHTDEFTKRLKAFWNEQ